MKITKILSIILILSVILCMALRVVSCYQDENQEPYNPGNTENGGNTENDGNTENSGNTDDEQNPERIGLKANELTWREYKALDGEAQKAYYNSFSQYTEFFDWQARAKKAWEDAQDREEIDGNNPDIDLGK